MLGHERRTAAVLSAAMVVALASVAHAAPEIYPLEKVHRGQTGYGMTTMAGTVPERFTFEVVSVMHNFLPKQDIILVKSDDPKVQLTGFWQGMSGSPLFIEDKLACAFSYGFRFNKVALGGCTPLQYMKQRRSRLVPPRRRASAEGRRTTRDHAGGFDDGRLAALDRHGRSASRARRARTGAPQLVAIGAAAGGGAQARAGRRRDDDRIGAARDRRVLGARVRAAREGVR